MSFYICRYSFIFFFFAEITTFFLRLSNKSLYACAYHLKYDFTIENTVFKKYSEYFLVYTTPDRDTGRIRNSSLQWL